MSEDAGSVRHRERMQRKKASIDGRIAEAATRKGVLLINTGVGKGKSSAAFGVMARALGNGMQVAVVQFVKNRTDTGEAAFFQRCGQVRWHVMGEGFTWETQDRARDALAAQQAWAQGRAYLADPAVDLLILDEMTYAFKYGWLDVDAVIADLKARPPLQHVIITGRAAPQALIDAADTVTDMSLVKHAFKDGVAAMPGMEF